MEDQTEFGQSEQVDGNSLFLQDLVGQLTPCQLRDMTLVSVGVTFQPAIVLAHLPHNLRAAEGFTGGFFVTLAREGHILAPYGTGRVWFDIQGHDGTAGPCRFQLRQSGPTAGPDRRATDDGRAQITESGNRVVACLNTETGPAFRLTIRPRRNWCASAGIDHSILQGDALQPATRLTVIPWAADWCDAEPEDVEIIAPHMAGLKPTHLNWAALGKQGAMTLGLSTPLPG